MHTPVHLVGHEIDPELLAQPLVTAERVSRPRGMPAVAERLLGRAGVRVARAALQRAPRARVVVNGGNCPWGDINWVHAVHAAWPVCDKGAPWWSRVRNRRLKARARQRESEAVGRARVVIANSNATRDQILRLGVPPERVCTIHLGSDPAWGAADAAERRAAREALRLPVGRPVVAFAGPLGTDVNKGFDLLLDAWLMLHRTGRWDAQLVVAGSGWRRSRWEAAAHAAGAGSVRFVGFSTNMRQVLAAADLLVSPARYEAYGLNVHEALCCGVPVMVTRTAGVVERFDAGLEAALLPCELSARELADRLRAWRGDMDGWRSMSVPTARRLRAWTWDDMAAAFVRAASGVPLKVPA
jgi:glycosyltransferase involved in cell wall biosynthesis